MQKNKQNEPIFHFHGQSHGQPAALLAVQNSAADALSYFGHILVIRTPIWVNQSLMERGQQDLQLYNFTRPGPRPEGRAPSRGKSCKAKPEEKMRPGIRPAGCIPSRGKFPRAQKPMIAHIPD